MPVESSKLEFFSAPEELRTAGFDGSLALSSPSSFFEIKVKHPPSSGTQMKSSPIIPLGGIGLFGLGGGLKRLSAFFPPPGFTSSGVFGPSVVIRFDVVYPRVSLKTLKSKSVLFYSFFYQ
jgi:hypothetical protein